MGKLHSLPPPSTPYFSAKLRLCSSPLPPAPVSLWSVGMRSLLGAAVVVGGWRRRRRRRRLCSISKYERIIQTYIYRCAYVCACVCVCAFSVCLVVHRVCVCVSLRVRVCVCVLTIIHDFLASAYEFLYLCVLYVCVRVYLSVCVYACACVVFVDVCQSYWSQGFTQPRPKQEGDRCVTLKRIFNSTKRFRSTLETVD